MINQIKKSFRTAEEKKYEKLYYLYDIHETILYPDYTNTKPLKFYPYAKEALQLMTRHPMLVNILFTCSHPEEIITYRKFFSENDIEFHYANENPEVENTTYGDFSVKPYFNALFDDKSSFDAETEWYEIYQYFHKLMYGGNVKSLTDLLNFTPRELQTDTYAKHISDSVKEIVVSKTKSTPDSPLLNADFKVDK